MKNTAFRATALDQIESCLGRPAFQCDGVLLYEGDCRDLMHGIGTPVPSCNMRAFGMAPHRINKVEHSQADRAQVAE